MRTGLKSKRLELATNVAIILTCVLFSIYLGFRIYNERRPVAAAVGYRVGETIAETPELTFTASSMTALLVTKSSCHFCTENMPFYRRLIEVARGSSVRLIALSTEEPAANRAYLLSNKVQVEAVLSSTQNGLRQLPTPTLILVNREGRILKIWVGMVNEAGQNEVLKAISE
jgi:hypothetical protein